MPITVKHVLCTLLLITSELGPRAAMVKIDPPACSMKPAYKGDSILPFLRQRRVQPVAKELPGILNCVEVWQMLGVPRQHLNALLLKSRLWLIAPETLFIIL